MTTSKLSIAEQTYARIDEDFEKYKADCSTGILRSGIVFRSGTTIEDLTVSVLGASNEVYKDPSFDFSTATLVPVCGTEYEPKGN